MVAFIDDHREAHGVEPICKVLPIAPSTSITLMSPGVLIRASDRVFDDNFQVYGVRKVWRQLRRNNHDVARCTVERLMRDMGAIRGEPVRTGQGQGSSLPAGSRQSSVPGAKSERALGLRLHSLGSRPWQSG
jgi:transposase InsO family protein